MKPPQSPREMARELVSRDFRIVCLSVLTTVLLVFLLVPARTTGGSMAVHFEKPQEAYWRGASDSLSKWQGSLFSRMAALYRASTDCGTTQCPAKPTEPIGHDRFSLFNPFVGCPPGMLLKRWGLDGDGGKWLCGVETLKEGCVILSLGSRGNFDFEDSMLANTPCEVHTFDCTYDGASRDPRHHYHKKCLGSPEKAKEDPNFISLAQAVQDNHIEEVSLLKMDIEGFEYDVMSLWQKGDPLPEQVSFELHWLGIYDGTKPDPAATTTLWFGRDVILSELTVFLAHLAHLGYAIVSKEDNDLCGHCSELTLIRVRH